jgi:2,3-dihydroxybenzoate decarboxylase
MIRIATEEAWATPDLLERYRKLLHEKPEAWDPGFRSLWGFFLGATPRASALAERIQDLGARRIADMDASGIAKQLLLLTSPGVQVFDAATGSAIARESNDVLSEAVRKHPDRYAGLAAIAPHDPANAVQEMERAVRKLGLKGAVVNSHTRGRYLDEPDFWPLFEAAQALDVPIYIHPNTPPNAMIQPFLPRGLDGAIYGFAVDAGLHLLRIIVGGVFDRFPKLKIAVGHLGEGLPFWLFRLDYMHRSMVTSKRYIGAQPLKKKVSDYLKENVWITTSGMQWAPAIQFCQQVLGYDRVLYAMDYPYQFVPEEVKVTDDMPITGEQRKLLYQTNAERLFKL